MRWPTAGNPNPVADGVNQEFDLDGLYLLNNAIKNAACVSPGPSHQLKIVRSSSETDISISMYPALLGNNLAVGRPVLRCDEVRVLRMSIVNSLEK